MARTRRQITLQEQESGVPVSPPQSLPTATRSTRAKRTTTRNNTTTAPADPTPSTRGGSSVRGGRIGKAKKVGRGRAQPLATTSHDEAESSAMDVDAHEASDSSTHAEEAAVQASPATAIVLNDNEEMEHMEDVEELDVEPPGETQFPTGVSAHPVQVQDLTAHPVQGSTTPQTRRESATSLKFREILEGSLRSPLSTPLSLSPISIPSRESPAPASPIQMPSTQAPNPAELKVHCVPRDPEWSHTLLNVSMDFFQGSKDSRLNPQFAALAVPSDIMASVFKYIEAQAEPGSDLSKITADHPVIKAVVQRDARNRPQLPSWQARRSPPISGSTMKDGFVLRARRKRELRVMKEEADRLKAENEKLRGNAAKESHFTTVQTKTNEVSQPVERPQRRVKVVPDPYTADGQLLLGRTKEIEVDEDGLAINPVDEPTLRWHDFEEARASANVVESPYAAEETPNTDGPALGGLFAELQDQVEPEQLPETPRPRRWGLSSFLPSARSVTKYIPFSSRRGIPTPQHQPSTPQQLAQTEPRVNAGSFHVQPDPDAAPSVAGPGHRHHQSASNQQRLLTKEQSEEEKRIKRMRAKLRREAEALEKQKKDLEIAKKDLAEQQKLADIAQTPGQKRKRMPSPDVIPLPANGGYGMVDEYFVVESSSDEDAAAQETPTKERPLKKARTRPDSAIVGSPFGARPYTGTLFAHPDVLQSGQDHNVFVGSDKPEAFLAMDSTPPPGPTLTFKVPSPGSSDSDDEDDDEQEQQTGRVQQAPSPTPPGPKGILRNSTFSSNPSQHPTVNSPSPAKPMAPPPRPNPGHAILPAATVMTPSGALEKARWKALRHQPKQPSTLRESSRLSTSTVNSDGGDENIDEYDPAHPAIVTSPSKAAVLGQPPTTAVSAFGASVINSTAPREFQQPVTQPVSARSHEQQAMAEPSGNQAETTPDVFAAAHFDNVKSSGQQAMLAKKQDENTSDADANMSRKVKADMDRYWEEHGDDYVLNDGYEEFQEQLVAEEQEMVDGPNGNPYSQPHNIISAALDQIGADSLSDRGIMTEIEDNWRPEDLERTEADPAKGMRMFFNRLVKNGGIEKDLADYVVSMGVPPGVAEYFAGQRAMGPVAA